MRENRKRVGVKKGFEKYILQCMSLHEKAPYKISNNGSTKQELAGLAREEGIIQSGSREVSLISAVYKPIDSGVVLFNFTVAKPSFDISWYQGF